MGREDLILRESYHMIGIITAKKGKMPFNKKLGKSPVSAWHIQGHALSFWDFPEDFFYDCLFSKVNQLLIEAFVPFLGIVFYLMLSERRDFLFQ